jgi:hypothetical protein
MSLVGFVLASLLWFLAYLYLRYPERLFSMQNAVLGRRDRMTDRGRTAYRVGGSVFAFLGAVVPFTGTV